MHTPQTLSSLAAALEAFGIPAPDADRFAALIGDTPEVAGDQVLIRDDSGEIIARVPARILD